MNKEETKTYLLERLNEEHSFWSYDKSSCRIISDYNLIKHVLIRLDLEDINLLFNIFSKNRIKQVWLRELVTQGDYLKNMNLCFASIYFNVKHPVQYLKSMETYQINRKWTAH